MFVLPQPLLKLSSGVSLVPLEVRDQLMYAWKPLVRWKLGSQSCRQREQRHFLTKLSN
jgi:hypothetical protein